MEGQIQADIRTVGVANAVVNILDYSENRRSVLICNEDATNPVWISPRRNVAANTGIRLDAAGGNGAKLMIGKDWFAGLVRGPLFAIRSAGTGDVVVVEGW